MRTPALRFATVLVLSTLVGAAPAEATPFPAEVGLPSGFRPEGIVVGRGATFYAGSLADGALWRGDLRTGAGDEVFPGDGTPTVGLAVDERERVYAAGGGSGTGKVFDGRTGALLRTYTFTEAPTFVNDVVTTGEHAWFTDSRRPVLYRVPLDGSSDPVEVPLGGDYVHQGGNAFNLNGIEATVDGRALVAVQSATGKLFRIDPATGMATEIDTGGVRFANGDGLLLDEDRTLHVVRNRDHVVVAVRLSPDLATGDVVDESRHPRFDVPTTVDRFGSALYLVNARFTTTPTPGTEYWVTRLEG